MIDILIVIIGIFVVTAFSIVIFQLNKHQAPIGYWPLIAVAAAFVTLAELLLLMGNEEIHTFLVIITLILFFIVALLKFYDTLRLVEKP